MKQNRKRQKSMTESIFRLCQKFCKKGIMLLFFLASVVGLKAQTNSVNGVVQDKNGEPLIGVSVVIKGTSTGTITDFNGVYEINVPSNGTLVFSYIGMLPSEVPVGTKRRINVIMNEDRKELDELVVIGYGSVKKRDLTGSVSSVRAADMNMTASSSVLHSLKGKASGLILHQNSAQPGGGLNINIRGLGAAASTEPLYIVDGFPITALDQLSSGSELLDAGTQGALNFINPNDIVSIEVLKDASSTAIYGARASNGVILITTKNGSEGRTQINYNASYGIQKHSNIFDLYSLKEWMVAKNNSSWDFWMFENEVVPYGLRSLEDAMNNPKNGVAYKLPYTDTQIENAGPGTNWIDLITRLGSIQQHNINMQGGNENTKYMVSLNYFDHQGIIKNSGLKRYTGKISLDQKINNYIKAGVNIIASRVDNNNRALGGEQWEKSGLLRAAVQMGPHIQAIDENGNYPINPMLPTQPNPYSLLNVIDNGRMDRFFANGNITVEPIQGLTFRLNMGTDIAYRTRKTYMPKTTLHGGLSGGIATLNEAENAKLLVEGTANYTKVLNDMHNFGVMVGVSAEKEKASNFNAGNNGFIIDGFTWNSLNAGEGTKVVGSSGYENNWRSYFTRVNYSLLDRYLFTATFRADGASIFAKNHKWGYFPSAAIAWNITEEAFMKNLRSTISLFKLRLGYGQTGSSELGTNAFAAYYASPAWNLGDKSVQIGVFPDRLENPNLKWETTTELNLGIDLAFLDGKIGTTIELYNRVVSDLLAYKQLNTFHDINYIADNIGKMGRKGVELTVNTKNITKRNFTWATDITFSSNIARWIERAEDWKPEVYRNVDDPVYAIFGRRADHILQIGETPPASQPDLRPGQIVIKDINGYQRDEYGDPMVDENGKFLRTGAPDGIIDEADNEVIGTSEPKAIFGMSNRFRYKNIDFSFDFNGMFGRIMMDPTHMALGASADGIAQYGYNGLRILDTRWTPENASTTQPSSFYGWSRYGYGDWFYQKAWFVRLQNITVGYTFPTTPALKKVFSSFRVYVDANNLLVFTPYKGLDPETDSYAAAYPNARTFTFGLDIRF